MNKIALATLASAAFVSAADYYVAVPIADVEKVPACTPEEKLYDVDAANSAYKVVDEAATFAESACALEAVGAEVVVKDLPAACAVQGGAVECPLAADAVCDTATAQFCVEGYECKVAEGAEEGATAGTCVVKVEPEPEPEPEPVALKKTVIEVKPVDKEKAVDWVAVGKLFADYAASEAGAKDVCATFFSQVKYSAQQGNQFALVFAPVEKCDDAALKEFLTAAVKPAEGQSAVVELAKVAKFEDATVDASCLDADKKLVGCGAKCAIPCKEGVECADKKDCFDGSKCVEVEEEAKPEPAPAAEAKKVCSSASMYSVLAAASVAALALFF
jgi:hypothetical protein